VVRTVSPVPTKQGAPADLLLKTGYCVNAGLDQDTSHSHARRIRQQLHMFTVKFTLAKAGTYRYRSCS